MTNLFRRTALAAVLVLSSTPGLGAQTEGAQTEGAPGAEPPSAAAEAQEKDAPQEPATPAFDDSTPLGGKLSTIAALRTRREEVARDLAAAGEGERADSLRRQLGELESQIEGLAMGVTEGEYQGDKGAAFDLNTELEALVEPFVAMMKDATENARQIERLRRSAGEARQRESMARRAVAGLDPLIAAAGEDSELGAELAAMRETWRERETDSREFARALEQQLDTRLSERTDTRTAAEEAASSFFKDRGLSLLYGFGLFALVFTALRFAGRAIARVRQRRRRTRTFGARLFDLAFHVFTIVAATGAMLVVFNLRHDWLLLGAFGVLLLALAWAGIKMIPGAIEQVTLLLNLGAVQEGERVLKDGVPYRVVRLDLYTELDNPRLEGALTTLPVRELIGMHSRPSGPNEPWFPTRRGDFVRLSDGVRGTVISQSPEHVELQIAGGSHVTYATPDFLSACPDNLSDGFRAEVNFGIGYVHQAEATTEVLDKLQAHVAAGLEEVVPKEQIRDVSVEILEASDSAIVYEIEADLTGEAAPRIEAVERSMAKLCIEACNRFGWEIPFPQMVLHHASSASADEP